MTELGESDGAGGAVFRGDDGQHVEVMAVDQPQGLGAGRPQAHGVRVDRHEVADARRDVAQVMGQGRMETLEDGINAGVGIAAAGRHVAEFPAGFLEGGVGDGGAD